MSDDIYPDVTPHGVPRTKAFLANRIDTLKSEMDDISAKIDRAKRTAKATGVYCDPDWLTDLEAAKRRRGTAIQSLQLELGARPTPGIEGGNQELRANLYLCRQSDHQARDLRAADRNHSANDDR